MTVPLRRFHCAEADHLTDHGIPLRHAQRYDSHYGVGSIVRLYEANIGPYEANAAHWSPEDVVARTRLSSEVKAPQRG